MEEKKKNIFERMKSRYDNAMKWYEVFSKIKEDAKNCRESVEKRKRALGQFGELRQNASADLGAALKTIAAARGRGYEVVVEDAPGVKMTNYGSMIKLEATSNEGNEVLYVDPNERAAYRVG